MSIICDDLRAAILQAAMQGKLTEQLSEDGNAEDLLEAIQALKSNDKKPKIQLGAVKNNDKPFDIPSGWCWGYFGDLVFNHDSERKPVSKEKRSRDNGQYPYYGATGAIDVVDDYIFDGDYLMIGEDGGNFFVSRDNSFIAHGKFWANNHVHVVSMTNMDINYMKRFLDSCNLPAMGLINGIAVPKLNQKNLNSIAVPIPPFAEQKRIAEKVDELMARVADLEQSADALASLKKAFPDDIKASLLQAAMQGKLTKQLPEDGSAEDLLEEIKAEKEKLPRKKKELPVLDDEIPFEIPDSWRWQKLENISTFIGDKSNQIKESLAKKEGKYKVVSQSKELFIGYHDDERKLLKIDHPVLVFGDHTALIKYIDFNFIIGADGVKVIDPICVDIKYLYYALKYLLIGVNELGGYSRHYKFIKDKLIPLPPLAEQKRISERLDALMQNINVVGDLIASE